VRLPLASSDQPSKNQLDVAFDSQDYLEDVGARKEEDILIDQQAKQVYIFINAAKQPAWEC